MVPRAVGVIVASLTDYYTYWLSSKLLGHGSAPTAVRRDQHSVNIAMITHLMNSYFYP